MCSVSMNLRTRGIFPGSSLRSASMKQNFWNANIADRFLKRGYELPCKDMCSQNSGPFADTDFVVTLLNLARLTLGSKFKSTNDVDTGHTGFSYADNLGRCVVYSAVVLSLCELTGVVTIDVGIKMFLAASMLVCGIAEDCANYRSISMYKALPCVVNEKIKTKVEGYEAFGRTELNSKEEGKAHVEHSLIQD